MLNTLANHAFLPHDGKAISESRVIHALGAALNISESLSKFLFSEAITTSPQPNATTFTLEDLGRHNILEHDASLSRSDYFFNHDPYSFNASVFAETQSFWHGDTITLKMAAEARIGRLITSNRTNPTYSLSDLGSDFSVGETAAYILLLGDDHGVSGTVKRELVEYLFQHERLPVEKGWATPSTAVTEADLFELMDRVVNATKLTPEDGMLLLKRGDLHAGRRKA
jgi:hypothetical protein